jgi:hypothetical protein
MMRVGGLPPGVAMTVTEPPEPTAASTFGRALLHIGNHGPAFPHCLCGHCLASDDYSDTELALDACISHMQVMISIIESSTPEPHPSTWLSLRVLYDLVDDARKLLCVQRKTTRALASLFTRP